MSIQRARRENERGAIMVIFALTMVVMIGMLAIAIDLSYGFVENRRAQNASDFAAFAATQQLNGTSTCNGTAAAPNMAQLVAMVQDLTAQNAADVGTQWTGTFLNGSGTALTGAGATFGPNTNNLSTEFPPFGACGVAVNATPSWNTAFAGVFGVTKLNGGGNAKVANTGKSKPFGIISLNPSGPHAILGGGSGSFTVSGDIVLNTNVKEQPWTEQHNSWSWDDAIDAKSGSNLKVYGTINTVSGTASGDPLWPLDWCFGENSAGQDMPIQGEGDDASGSNTYGSGQQPNYDPPCSVGTVTVEYDNINPTISQITDPLQSTGAPTDPFSAKPACPGLSSMPQWSTTNVTAPTTLAPGEYLNPVTITSSATFGDCSASSDPSNYPGVYIFDQGLYIDPPAGDTVSSGGAGVVLATKTPYQGTQAPGNVSSSGTGNGGPCLPGDSTVSGAPGTNPRTGYEVDETMPCSLPGGGTAMYGTEELYGVTAYTDAGPFSQDKSNYGTGSNFSLLIGGAGTVNLTGPTYGGYGGSGSDGLVLYQSSGTQANFGFDAEPGDSATINLNGVVYNASLTTSPTYDFWDNGIPFYAGGTLQAGYGAGWSDPPASSGTGSVTITGTAIVDDFNTDGSTGITILGKPYDLPGGGSLSLVG
jgi:Flp pilus assembly protein TadG